MGLFGMTNRRGCFRRRSPYTRSLDQGVPEQYFFQGGGHAIFAIGSGLHPATIAQFFRRVAHDDGDASIFQHFDVVIVVANGHDLFAEDAAMCCPAFQRLALGATVVQDVDHAEIAFGVFRSENGDAILQAADGERLLDFLHAGEGSAKHGLDGIFGEGVLDGDYKFDVFEILFQPATDADADFVQVFQNQSAFGFLVEGDDEMAAKFVHGTAHFKADFFGHQVAMESFSRERPCDGAVGADHAKVDAQFLGDVVGEVVPAAGGDDDFDAHGVGLAHGRRIFRGNLEFVIQQGAVNING